MMIHDQERTKLIKPLIIRYHIRDGDGMDFAVLSKNYILGGSRSFLFNEFFIKGPVMNAGDV